MPNYSYKCPKCAEIQEISHSINDSPTIYCPKCSVPTRKVMGVGAVTFKGNGWGHQ